MTFRSWISVITIVLILAILFFSRHELERAWQLMSSVNLWILALVAPVLLLSYYAAGEMIFSFLRQKGSIKHISALDQIRLTIELNFVNHIMPSGGASGMTYLTLRLKEYGVAASKATMAQFVRFLVGFAAFITLLVVAVIMITVDGEINRSIILVSSTLVTLMVGVTALTGYFIWKKSRVEAGAKTLTKVVNVVVTKITFGRAKNVLKVTKVRDFMLEMHDDVIELKRTPKLLLKPFIWALVFTVSEIAVFFIVFWSLGALINPAPILIAYGLATIAGFIVVTPGGSGAYEALMVGFLNVAGLDQGTALAGVVLSRVIILMVILIIGYAFYQNAVAKYGIKKK